MPKFLIKASYSADGVRGLIKEGGSKRRAAVQKIDRGHGGKARSLLLRVWGRRCGDHHGSAGCHKRAWR